ncbi:MAG: hypothetical protein WKF31_12690 [Thermoleophilaceae bacterium]
MAIVALVLGIVGIVTALFTAGVLGILLGIVAIILGVLGRRKVSSGRSREHGGLALGGPHHRRREPDPRAGRS